MMNSSAIKGTLAFCLQPMKIAPAVTGLLMLVLLAPAAPRQSNDGRLPDLGACQNLHVQEGNKVLFSTGTKAARIRLSLDTRGRSLYISRERSTFVSWGSV